MLRLPLQYTHSVACYCNKAIWRARIQFTCIAIGWLVGVEALQQAQQVSYSNGVVRAQSVNHLNTVLVDHWVKAATKHLPASTTASSATCSAGYGLNYLRRWRALHDTYCNSSNTEILLPPGSNPEVSSTVHCYAHPEADISVCSARNLVLTSSLDFLGAKDSGIPGLPNPKRGSILLACEKVAEPTLFLRGRLQSNEGSRMWLVQAPTHASGPATRTVYERIQQACSPSNRVQHPVLVLMRVDPENAFHNLEGVISVFAALAVLQQEVPKQAFQHGLEVVIADDRLPGYFLDIWRRLSHPLPLRFLRQQPFPDNACFSLLLLAPYTAHAQSLLTYKAGTADEVLCQSVVLQAASMWLRHLFRDLLPIDLFSSGTGDDMDRSLDRGVSTSSSSDTDQNGPPSALDLAHLQPTHTQSQPPLQQLYVLWVSRSRFERQHGAHLSGWQRARQLPADQQEQLLIELGRAVLQWNHQTCVPGQLEGCKPRTIMFTLQVAELSELPFYPDQLPLLMRTGILLGVHGAGLANQVFMKPRLGAVIELWFNMEDNYHYHNMAHMLGHKYYNVRSEEQVDVEALVGRLVEAMDAVAEARAAAAVASYKQSWWKRGWGGGAVG